MRTTITLDDRLLERLKKRAVESGTSVSGIIERAVRLLLQAPASQSRDRFDLVTFGEGGQFTPRAHRQDAPEHDRCAAWLRALVEAPEPFAVAEIVLAGFLRIVTNPNGYDKEHLKPVVLPLLGDHS